MTIGPAPDVDEDQAPVDVEDQDDEPDPLAVWSPLGWPASAWPDLS